MVRRNGDTRLWLMLAVAGVVLWPDASDAEVATDGTLGARVRLADKDVTVPARLGQVRGQNLFHSFERFGIEPGDTVTFTAPERLKLNNVIGRVTGGERSEIHGTLASKIEGADLWLLNPAGILFGLKARLEVPGSFHASTADELRFADGKVFSALDPQGSVLSVAAPQAFGFLRARPAPIDVNRGMVEVPKGEALSLVGGDVTVRGESGGAVNFGNGPGTARAPAGRITVAALGGPGAVVAGTGEATGAVTGTVRLTGKAAVTTSGGGGGTIRIRGGQLLVEGTSYIFADNDGASDATGGVAIEAGDVAFTADSAATADAVGEKNGGTVTVKAGTLTFRERGTLQINTRGDGDGGELFADVDRLVIVGDGSKATTGIVNSVTEDAAGRAGRVTVTADTIELRNRGIIASDTFGDGKAGEVTVTARRSLLADGQGTDEPTGIFSTNEVVLRDGKWSIAQGDAGRVKVTARRLELRNRGVINTGTFTSGSGGETEVDAGELVIAGDGSAAFTGIFSGAAYVARGKQLSGPTGRAGRVQVTADMLELRDGGAISSATFGAGNAGEISVTVTGRLLIDDNHAGSLTGILSDSIAERVDGRQIVATGDAGKVTVTAGGIALRDGGLIGASATGYGPAGDVSVTADTLEVQEASIRTVGTGAKGGRIVATGFDLISLQDAEVTSNGIEPEAGASIVTLTAPLIALNASRVTSLTGAGRPLESSGQARLFGEQTVLSADSVVEASSSVTISGLESEIGSRLAVPQGMFLNAGDLLRESCAARRSGSASSFTAMGRGGLPPDPAGPLAAAYSGITDAASGGRETGTERLSSPGRFPWVAALGCGREPGG
jgi:filamentous hemagglutinin family protein